MEKIASVLKERTPPVMFGAPFRGNGTVIADFERVVNYIIEQKGIPVGENHSLFAMKTLSTLNSLLTHPIKHDLQRPIQKNFPHLYALNVLLRFSGLARLVQNKKESILYIDQETFHSWNGLNNEEKYYNLLCVMFLSGIGEALNERFMRNDYEYSFMWLTEYADKEKRLASYEEQRIFGYRVSACQLGFFDLFGFISIEHAEPEVGCGWRFTSVCSTSFGVMIGRTLLKNARRLDDYSRSIVEMRQAVQRILKPYVPSWRRNLVIYLPKPLGGVHIFKVSLCGSWKTIAVSAETELSFLANAILSAFHFDSDHLYYFSCKDWRGISIKIYHDYVSEADYYVGDYTIALLNLEVGQSLTFLFDFGDEWTFELRLIERDPPDLKITEPTVLQSGGKPVPEQYSYPDD